MLLNPPLLLPRPLDWKWCKVSKLQDLRTTSTSWPTARWPSRRRVGSSNLRALSSMDSSRWPPLCHHLPTILLVTVLHPHRQAWMCGYKEGSCRGGGRGGKPPPCSRGSPTSWSLSPGRSPGSWLASSNNTRPPGSQGCDVVQLSSQQIVNKAGLVMLLDPFFRERSYLFCKFHRVGHEIQYFPCWDFIQPDSHFDILVIYSNNCLVNKSLKCK